MKNPKLLVLLIIITLVLSAFQAAAQDKEESKTLKWKKVEGAAAYIVEIKKGDRNILKTESTENFIYLDLPPGEYLFNISVLNKFSKKTAETGWKKLTIEAARQPAVKKYSPSHIYLGKDRPALEIDAHNIKDRSVFTLMPDSGEAVEGKVENINDSVYTVVFPQEKLLKGFYSLSVINPSGLKDTALDRFEVREELLPLVDGLSEREFLNRGVYSNIIISGENFEKNIKVEFRSDSKTVYPASVEFLSGNEISVILDLTSAEADKYRVYVENPSGLSDFSKQTIKIHERTDETELMMKGFKKDIITVLGGYTYGYCLNKEEDYHNYNYDGITTAVQFDFNNSFFNKYIWLYPIGAEINYSHFFKDIYINEIGLNLYYKSRFESPFNFIVKGGAGFSIFEDTEYAPEYGRFFISSAGLSMNFFKHFYIEATTGFKTWKVEGDYSETDFIVYHQNTIAAGLTY